MKKWWTDDVLGLHKLSVIWLRTNQEKLTLRMLPVWGQQLRPNLSTGGTKMQPCLCPCVCSGGKLWEPWEARPEVTLVIKIDFSADSREKGNTKISFPVRARPTLCSPQLCRVLPAVSLPSSPAREGSAFFPLFQGTLLTLLTQPAPGTSSLPHLATINFAFNLCCIIAFSWGFPIYVEGKMLLLGLEIFCYLFLLKCEAFLSVISGDFCYSGTDFIHLLNAL